MKKNLAIVALAALLILSLLSNVALASTKLPRPFLNEAELREWISEYPIRRGGDCDDQALRLFWDAWNDGYLVWPCPVYNGYVMGEKVISTYLSGKRHFGSWAWAGNHIYYIDLRMLEPQYKRLERTWLD